MRGKDNPCYGCTEATGRTYNCHTLCDGYKQFQDDCKEEKNVIKRKRTAKNKKFANTAVKNSNPKLQVTLVVITADTNKRRSETQGRGLIGARKQILTRC